MIDARPLLLAGSLFALSAGSAFAGPCTEQIAEVRKTMAQSSALGATTSGTLSGGGVGSVPQAEQGQTVKPSDDPKQASGEAGMSQMNKASGQVATSAQDVRQQQQGQPTAAQGGSPAGDERMTQAKMELERAVRLDQEGSGDCTAALEQARKMIEGG